MPKIYLLHKPQIPYKRLISKDQIDYTFYTNLTDKILQKFYPKTCCGSLLTKTDGSRELILRCPECHRQQSRLSGTPLHKFKLPRAYFSYILKESITRYPQVITSSEISRRLDISIKSALLLKRRIQIFASELLPRMKSKFYSDLQKEFSDFNFPTDRDTDLTELIKGKKVPQADTLALFSCRSTANKGRKRFKRTGQTASIYRSESLGGDQVGTLVNVLGVKQGPVFYESIPNQKAETVNPIIRSLIPHRTPIFTDMGYSSLGPNHRRVNHSLKSPDKRYKFNRQRWSKNGIHCQVPESQNNILKKAFRSYVYIKPKYSTLYLNEFSFFGNLRYFSLDDLTEEQGSVRVKTAADKMRGKVKKICPKFFYYINRKYPIRDLSLKTR